MPDSLLLPQSTGLTFRSIGELRASSSHNSCLSVIGNTRAVDDFTRHIGSASHLPTFGQRLDDLGPVQSGGSGGGYGSMDSLGGFDLVKKDESWRAVGNGAPFQQRRSIFGNNSPSELGTPTSFRNFHYRSASAQPIHQAKRAPWPGSWHHYQQQQQQQGGHHKHQDTIMMLPGKGKLRFKPLSDFKGYEAICAFHPDTHAQSRSMVTHGEVFYPSTLDHWLPQFAENQHQHRITFGQMQFQIRGPPPDKDNPRALRSLHTSAIVSDGVYEDSLFEHRFQPFVTPAVMIAYRHILETMGFGMTEMKGERMMVEYTDPSAEDQHQRIMATLERHGNEFVIIKNAHHREKRRVLNVAMTHGLDFHLTTTSIITEKNFEPSPFGRELLQDLTLSEGGTVTYKSEATRKHIKFCRPVPETFTYESAQYSVTFSKLSHGSGKPYWEIVIRDKALDDILSANHANHAEGAGAAASNSTWSAQMVVTHLRLLIEYAKMLADKSMARVKDASKRDGFLQNGET